MGSDRTPLPFVGKGPKGYARSDERIREDICELLSEGHLDASDIEVVVTGGEVTLSGTVSDRQTKRLAEEITDSAQGVKDIENRLKVQVAGQGQIENRDYSAGQANVARSSQPNPKLENQSGNFNSGSRDQTPSEKRSFV